MTSSTTLKERLKKLDGQNTVSNEFRVYTIQGAIISVTTICIILYLVITEVSYNFQVIRKEVIHVNSTSSTGLEMEFDISFPNIPCVKLSIDANDIHGQSQSLHLDQKHHIYKHRIKINPDDGHKTYIGSKSKLEMGSSLLKETDLMNIIEVEGKVIERKLNEEDEEDNSIEKTMNDGEESSGEEKCGSCYGAGDEGECCDTCEDVKRVYKRKGWVLRDVHTIQTCIDEENAEKASSITDQAGEGCNIHGIVALSTGGGNLHIAPGRDNIQTGFSIIDILFQSFQEWNVTHTIHKVRFGKEHPGSSMYQLDNINKTILDTAGMYQYYFQIVPTSYQYLNGTILYTNQYNVLEHLRHITPGSNRGLPGVFFFYEVSPLHIYVEETYHKGYIAFFTSVCAIIGGVVTLMGIIDQILFRLLNDNHQHLSGGLLK